MNRRLPVVVVGLVSGFSLCCASVRLSAEEPSTPAAAQEAKDAVGTSVAGKSNDFVARMWWNRPYVVKALDLIPAQRTTMDGLALKRRDTIVSAWGVQKEKRAAYEKALREGDWDGAQRAAADTREAMARSAAAMTDLTIDTVRLLRDEQRKELMTNHAAALNLGPGGGPGGGRFPGRGPWRGPQGRGGDRPPPRPQ